MAAFYFFGLFIIFHLIAVILTDDEINQRTNTRCDQICNDKELNLPEKYKPDCNRGCRYFNIEFITSAGNLEKVTDLNTTQNQCKKSCTQAYEELSRRDSCHLGCKKMFEIQSKAPYIYGWLVYMGASDRSMVALQPDFDLVLEDDWTLLDAALHPRGGYENVGDSYKLTQTRIQTMPIYPPRKNYTMEFCIPTWLWMIPVLLVLALIWLHYGNTIRNIFVYEDSDDENDDAPELPPKEQPKTNTDDYIVALESYFYPSPAIPPPKYNELEEVLLMSASEGDEEDDDVAPLSLDDDHVGFPAAVKNKNFSNA